MSAVQDSSVAPATEQPQTVLQDSTVAFLSDIKPEGKPEETPIADEMTSGAAPAEEKKEEAAAEVKPTEPISEGKLGYKAPGLLKMLTFSTKDFWLSDEAVSQEHLDLFLRGEKPEYAHPIAAWAGQTGKGLLFFIKKNETDKAHPHGVVPLYDATDLEKVAPNKFAFKIGTHKHQFEATTAAERDGWYMSIEKAVEMGKATAESVKESEGYKAELEKLNTPVAKTHGVAGVARSQSRPKKSTEIDGAEAAKRTGSSDGEEEQKKQKSRSTSRGMLNRLKGKKDETEQKHEEKKAEEEAEVAPETVIAAPVVAEPATTEAPVEEPKEVEQKPQKRGSIFGRMSSGFGSLKSPIKEKSQKDAELKPETPAKDGVVSENPPQLPETSVTEPTEAPVVNGAPAETETKPEVTKDAITTPSSEKKNFLGGLGFMNKRRSVSPSAMMKEAPAKTEAPVESATEPAEPAKLEEPATETSPVVPATEDSKPVEEPAKTEAAEKQERRTSVFTNLSRRASKAFKGMQSPMKEKKENAAPAATTEEAAAKDTETDGAAPTAVSAAETGESKAPVEAEKPQRIADVPADAITASSPPQQSTPTVTASA